MTTRSASTCPYCGQTIGRNELTKIEQHEGERLDAALKDAIAGQALQDQAEMDDVKTQLRLANEKVAQVPELVAEQLGAERKRISEEIAAQQQEKIKLLEEQAASFILRLTG